jgi:hypothetical protein
MTLAFFAFALIIIRSRSRKVKSDGSCLFEVRPTSLAFDTDLLPFDWRSIPFSYPLGSKLENILLLSGSRSQIHGDAYVV